MNTSWEGLVGTHNNGYVTMCMKKGVDISKMWLPMRIFLAQQCAVGNDAIGDGLQCLDDVCTIHNRFTCCIHVQTIKNEWRGKQTR